MLYTQVDPGRTGQRGERTEMDQELLKEGASVMESAEAHCLSSFPHKQQTARFSSPHT